MIDVIGIGSAFVDYFFEGDEKFLNKYYLKPEDDFLFEEKKLSPEKVFKSLPQLSISPGGVTPNTLAVLTELGIKTTYYGVIGKDPIGDYWINNIGEINKIKIIRKGKMSIAACILTHKRKYRTFLSQINPHDNDVLKNIDFNFLNKSKFIHIAPLMMNPNITVIKLASIVKKLTKPLISFSPGIFYINLGLKKISPILGKIYILFLNKDEMKKLTGKNAHNGSKLLLKKGPKIIVCTLGNKGTLITTLQRQFSINALKVKKVIDTTGAGDSYAAGFIYGLIKNRSIEWSAKYASKISAKSVTDFGLLWMKRK